MSTTKKISLQDIFNAAWNAFIIKKEPPGVTKNTFYSYSCKYLTPDGRKCAVGLCLPDGHISQNSELAFDNLVHIYPELFTDEVRSIDDDLLVNFQTMLHDYLIDKKTGEWKNSLEERQKIYLDTAKKYKLTIPTSL